MPMNKSKQQGIPTLRQFEALKYVYFMQLTHEEAGMRMNITQQAVSRLLVRLWEVAPELKGLCNEKKIAPQPRQFLTFIDNDSDGFDEVF